MKAGAPDRIRTCDLRLRRPTLYPLSYRRAGSRNHTPAISAQAVGTVAASGFGQNLRQRRNVMYWGGGIIGLILLILLILLLTGNL